LEAKDKNIRNENLSASNLIEARKSHANGEFRSISQEEKKKEASKPLYLARYE